MKFKRQWAAYDPYSQIFVQQIFRLAKFVSSVNNNIEPSVREPHIMRLCFCFDNTEKRDRQPFVGRKWGLQLKKFSSTVDLYLQ